MAAHSIVIRFPGGAWEARTVDFVPAVGDTVDARGRTWRVEHIDAGAVPSVMVRSTAVGGHQVADKPKID